jgi:MFS family permease
MIVGVYGGLWGVAVALGPIVGGLITEGIDWHWIFWINVPIGLAAVLLGVRLLPESRGAPERLDLAGVSLITAGVVALVWALTRANQVGWASAETVGTFAAGCMLLVTFLRWERRVAQPMAAPAARQPRVRSRQPHDLPSARRHVRRRVLHHAGVPARARLLPGRYRAAAAAVLRHADVRRAAPGTLSDRIGRRSIMLAGLALQALG